MEYSRVSEKRNPRRKKKKHGGYSEGAVLTRLLQMDALSLNCQKHVYLVKTVTHQKPCLGLLVVFVASLLPDKIT